MSKRMKMKPKEKMVMAQSLSGQSSPGKEKAKITLRGNKEKEEMWVQTTDQFKG